MKRKFNFRAVAATATKKAKPSVFILSEEYKDVICANAWYGQQGYTIEKKYLAAEDLKQIKEELTITPIQKQGTPVSFSLYLDNSEKVYLPSGYGKQRYGFPLGTKFDKKLHAHIPSNVVFTGTIRPDQQIITDIFVQHLSDQSYLVEKQDETGKLISSRQIFMGGGAIVEFPCGKGKTVIAYFLIMLRNLCMQGKKVLVIVPKIALMTQWIERGNQFAPGLRFGKIQGKIFDIENKDVVLATVQTLAKKEFAPGAFDSFGFMVCDEVHRFASPHHRKIFTKIQIPIKLGITATLALDSGLHCILNHYIGETIFSERRKGGDNVEVRVLVFSSKGDEAYLKIEKNKMDEMDYTAMLLKLCAYQPRTDFICRVLHDLVNEFPDEEFPVDEEMNQALLTAIETTPTGICAGCKEMGDLMKCCCGHFVCEICFEDKNVKKCPTCQKSSFRVARQKKSSLVPLDEFEAYQGQNQIIVFSLFRSLLTKIFKYVVRNKVASVGFFVSGMTEKELQDTTKKQIILATYGMASEGKGT